MSEIASSCSWRRTGSAFEFCGVTLDSCHDDPAQSNPEYLTLSKLVSSTARAVIGVLLALAASLISAHVFAGTDARTAVPLWFILVLYVLAWRYGFIAAVIGCLLCVFVFAHYLFDPTGSWHVEDAAARKSLLWMVIGTIAVSYLFSPSSSQRNDS